MPYAKKEDQAAYIRRNYEKRRDYVIAAKSKPCADCGIEYPYYVMEFDHVRGDKAGNISKLTQRRCIEKIQKEIDKCDIVCANCHRARTYEREMSKLL